MSSPLPAAAGGLESLRLNPTLLLYSEPSTPLKHSETATGKLLYMAEQGLPITHSPAPMMGGTAPVTLAGANVTLFRMPSTVIFCGALVIGFEVLWLTVTVTEGGQPSAGAQVCLWKGNETYVIGRTDVHIVGAWVTVTSVLSGVLNGLGWINVLIYLFGAIGCLYFLAGGSRRTLHV